jgi:hypothetical protein
VELTSPAFEEGGWIPRDHTGEGRDLSPPLHWRATPEGTRSLVLILEDPDAPAGLWIHWVLFNLPASPERLAEGIDRSPELPDGSRHGSCWGVDRFPRLGYHGPLPPPGPPHRYRFCLSALDGALDLPAGSSAPEVRAAMKGHVLATTTLTGQYQNGH